MNALCITAIAVGIAIICIGFGFVVIGIIDWCARREHARAMLADDGSHGDCHQATILNDVCHLGTNKL